MQQLELIAVQLDEASRLIQVDRSPHLRLAYMLVDNAIEVMMERSIQGETLFQDVNAKVLRELQDIEAELGDNPKFIAFLEKARANVISQKRLEEIDREFPSKVNFLVDRGHFNQQLGDILRRLHRYRNDMYHRMQIDEAVLQSITLVYFDVACSILSSMRYASSWQSGKEYTDLTKFGISSKDFASSNTTSRIADQLRETVGLDLATVQFSLIQHLDARVNQLREDITFISECLPVAYGSFDDTLRLLQLDPDRVPPVDELRKLRVRFSIRTLESWNLRIRRLGELTERDQMFSRFTVIEGEIERLEKPATALRDTFERMIQQEIDEQLGK